jgi:hypothetical protein
VCGCGVDQVARDVDARYAEARAIAEETIGGSLMALASGVRSRGGLRFNPSPFERDGVPGLGWRVDGRVDGEANDPPDEGLALRRDGDWVFAGDVAFRLLEEPDVGDLYNFCPVDGVAPAAPSELKLDAGEVVARWDGCEVRVRPRRPAGQTFLRLDGTITNERPDHRLRLHLALSEETHGSAAMSPFALVERPLKSEGSEMEAGSPTWPASGAVLAGGLAVYEEGVFEYEVTGRDLAITLLRATGTISRDSIPTRPWPAGPGLPTPEAQMIGRTAFSVAVDPGARREDLLDSWERFALPLLSVDAPGGGDLADEGTLLSVGGAALSAVRLVEGELEVRVWNPLAEEGLAVVEGKGIVLGPHGIATVHPRRHRP